MFKGVTIGLSICAVLALTSCATIVRGTSEDLMLNSTPRGANAELSNGYSCVTPCSVKISRNESFTVTFSKEGCDSETVSVFPTLAGSGVLLGGLVDYGTGAVYSLKPNPAIATLTCKSGEMAEQTIQVEVNSATQKRLQELRELLDQGLISPDEYGRKREEILRQL